MPIRDGTFFAFIALLYQKIPAMTLRIFVVGFSILVLSLPVKAQLSLDHAEQLMQYDDSLQTLAHGVFSAEKPEERFVACEHFIKSLVRALQVENSFYYPFESFESISIKYPADSTFRIFTWQLEVKPGEYRYYGAIQLNQPSLKLFPLIDRSFNYSAEAQEISKPSEWYGGVYYNLLSFSNGTHKYYLLFGYDMYTQMDRRKFIDVLTFDDDHQPVFGAPIFSRADGSTLNRFVMTFPQEASVKLNLEKEKGLIVFDHLIEDPRGGLAKVPDGSFDAFRLRQGKLEWVEKVFNGVSNQPIQSDTLDQTRLSNIKKQ